MIPTGLGTPAQKFAGPPRVVRFKRRISLSDLLSSTLVFTNYPLRTKLVRLKTTLNPTKKSSIKGGLFCWLGWLDSNQRMTIPKTVALPLGDTPIIFLVLISATLVAGWCARFALRIFRLKLKTSDSEAASSNCELQKQFLLVKPSEQRNQNCFLYHLATPQLRDLILRTELYVI